MKGKKLSFRSYSSALLILNY